MGRATRGEVCLDAGKTMRISVSGPLTAGFERRWLATKQFAVAQANQKGRSWPRTRRNMANVGLGMVSAYRTYKLGATGCAVEQ
jgi:hypothetical protein